MAIVTTDWFDQDRHVILSVSYMLALLIAKLHLSKFHELFKFLFEDVYLTVPLSFLCFTSLYSCPCKHVLLNSFLFEQ